MASMKAGIRRIMVGVIPKSYNLWNSRSKEKNASAAPGLRGATARIPPIAVCFRIQWKLPSADAQDHWVGRWGWRERSGAFNPHRGVHSAEKGATDCLEGLRKGHEPHSLPDRPLERTLSTEPGKGEACEGSPEEGGLTGQVKAPLFNIH